MIQSVVSNLIHLHIMMCCVFLQDGRTVLHVAAINNNVDVANLLLMKDSTLINQTDNVSEQIIYHVQRHKVATVLDH